MPKKNTNNSSTRGQFSSRLGFILAASGSAVGLGNIWGFPTNAAENGGGAFLLLYLILTFCLAYPVLMAELLIGRHNKANICHSLANISPSTITKRMGYGTGLYALLTASLILSFYCIVAGWMMTHLLQPFTAAFNLSETTHWLETQSPSRDICFSGIFLLLTAVIIQSGVTRGIERWSTRLMPALIIMMMLLSLYVITQPGALVGLKRYLVPDFSQLTSSTLIISAMGQAFFSLSLGVGTMLIYGSYLDKTINLPHTGALVTLVDTGVAFLAGLLIIPAMFVAQYNGVEIIGGNGELMAGPELIFHILPSLFSQLQMAGSILSTIFFFLLIIAALTSSISMLEVPVSYLTETTQLSRMSSTWVCTGVIFAISVVISCYFNQLFGAVVTLTTEYSQPMLGLAICLFTTWVWQRNKVLEELQQGNSVAEKTWFWKVWPHYVRFVCPVLILLVIIQSIT